MTRPFPRERRVSGSSSSPSPPPTKATKGSPVKSRVAHTPKKKNFRIPKKKDDGGDGGNDIEEVFEVSEWTNQS